MNIQRHERFGAVLFSGSDVHKVMHNRPLNGGDFGGRGGGSERLITAQAHEMKVCEESPRLICGVGRRKVLLHERPIRKLIHQTSASLN